MSFISEHVMDTRRAVINKLSPDKIVVDLYDSADNYTGFRYFENPIDAQVFVESFINTKRVML